MAKRVIEEAGRLNSLGLTGNRLTELVQRLDREQSEGNVNRDDARWPFPQLTIPVRLSHPGGSDVEVSMAGRNLSRKGASLLHSTYVHTGTPCVCVLPHPERGNVNVEGAIVRCQHRGGVIHELGVSFNKEIDIRAFANPDPLSQLFAAERVDTSVLEGTVLHVEPNEVDARAVTRALGETNVRLKQIETAAEAIELIHSGGYDLLLTESALPDMFGSEMAIQLRSENVSKPIVFLTHDISKRVTNAVKGKFVNAIIRKPLNEITLFQALAEFLRPGQEGEEESGQEGGGPEVSSALLKSLLPEINRCGRQIDEGIKSNSPTSVVGPCYVLQRVANMIGMDKLCTDVDSAIKQLSEDPDLQATGPLLKSIVDQCRDAA